MCGGRAGDLANCASDHVGKGHAGAPTAPFVRPYQYLAEARSYTRSCDVMIHVYVKMNVWVTFKKLRVERSMGNFPIL